MDRRRFFTGIFAIAVVPATPVITKAIGKIQAAIARLSRNHSPWFRDTARPCKSTVRSGIIPKLGGSIHERSPWLDSQRHLEMASDTIEGTARVVPNNYLYRGKKYKNTFFYKGEKCKLVWHPDAIRKTVVTRVDLPMTNAALKKG